MRSAILAIIALMALSSAALVSAAQLTGTAYTEGLQPAKYSLLQVDTNPPQRILLENGTYDLTLPLGTHRITVTYKERGILYDDTANVTIQDNGQYTYDFILFPVDANRTALLPAVPDIDDVPTTQAGPQSSAGIGSVPAIILLVVLVALVFLLSRRRWWERAAVHAQKQDTGQKAEIQAVAADLAAVIAAINAEGGRTTQKELRKAIPCSEAKLSMMLTEPEANGRIRKIKKGRGNLIILK